LGRQADLLVQETFGDRASLRREVESTPPAVTTFRVPGGQGFGRPMAAAAPPRPADET